MLVPETTMHKDHEAMSGQDDIGLAGQVAAVQSKPIAERVQKPPHSDLRLGIPRPDPRHQRAALRVDGLGHSDLYPLSSAAPLARRGGFDSIAEEGLLDALGDGPAKGRRNGFAHLRDLVGEGAQ